MDPALLLTFLTMLLLTAAALSWLVRAHLQMRRTLAHALSQPHLVEAAWVQPSWAGSFPLVWVQLQGQPAQAVSGRSDVAWVQQQLQAAGITPRSESPKA